jgi:rod shape-determining protein MreD
MSDTLKNIVRFTLFIGVQVFLLNRLPPLHRFVSPYLYFLFLLWLPFRIPRMGLTLLGFAFGLVLDGFTNTPGLHAASCTLVAYARPFLINLLMPKDATEVGHAEPSTKSMGLLPYAVYAGLLTFLHHLVLVFLEWMQFGDLWYLFMKVIATSLVSFLLIAVTELLFNRKGRYRTNVS